MQDSLDPSLYGSPLIAKVGRKSDMSTTLALAVSFLVHSQHVDKVVIILTIYLTDRPTLIYSFLRSFRTR